MTIAEKITTLNGIKQDIKTAIEARGVTVGSSPFGDYDTLIGQIQGGGISYPPLVIPTWSRPADWLAMPTISPTENKVAILVAVFPNGGQPNKVALQIDTIGYTVDWGDGSTTTHSGSTQAEHTYDFTNAALDGTLTTAGYKQAMIVMTPTTAGQNIPVIRFQQKYTGAPAGTIPTNFLDILVSAPSCVYASLGGTTNVKHFWLQRFRMLSGALNDVNGFAKDACWAMAVCELPPITSNLNATNMFYNCRQLIRADINCSTFNNTSGMFYECRNLVYANLTSTANSTSMSSMFNECFALVQVDGINIASSTNNSYMFNTCTDLLKVEFLGVNTITAFAAYNMFTGCRSLKEIIGLDLTKASTLNTAFYGCGALISLKNVPKPTTITDASGWFWAFRDCSSLVDVFDIVKGSANSFDGTFYGCGSLEVVNIDTFAGVTNVQNMFAGCPSLHTVNVGGVKNVFNTANVTTFNPSTSNPSFMAKCARMDTVTVDCAGCTGVAPTFQSTAGPGNGDCVGGVITLTNSAGITKFEPYSAYGALANNYNAREYIMSSAAGINADINASNFAKSSGAPGSLERLVLPGMKYTFSVAYNSMSAVAIDEMFTNLGTAAGAKTVTVTGNPGAAYCTPSIATAKGWTVVQ